jgi:hypothetical protein
MATLHTGILTADPGERVSERSPGPELRNNFCPVKNLSGAFDLTLSFSLALIIYARARVFKEYRLWREKEREVGVFSLCLSRQQASRPPAYQIQEKILKSAQVTLRVLHDVGGAGE